MPDSKPTSNVKIYDRPERKGPSPLLMILAALIVLILGFVVYRFVLHPAAATQVPAVSGAAGGRPVSSSP